MDWTVVKMTDLGSQIDNWGQVYRWGYEMFGASGDTWSIGKSEFYFADPADATAFLLRWA